MEDRLVEYRRIAGALLRERDSFIPHWMELSEYILPRRNRFDVFDVNKGDRRASRIIDCTATMAHRTARSSLLANLTNPSTRWANLSIHDPDIVDDAEAQAWLYVSTGITLEWYTRSNLYQVLAMVYGDLLQFGTAAMGWEEQSEPGAAPWRFYSFPIGSYAVSIDHGGVLTGFYREFTKTHHDLVKEFGKDNVSDKVKLALANGDTEGRVVVSHLVIPNDKVNPEGGPVTSSPWLSVYWEGGCRINGSGQGGQGQGDYKLLREGGRSDPGVLVARWEVTGEDSYGSSCPGMVALGDIKALQTGEKDALLAVQNNTRPPFVAPSHLRGKKLQASPGTFTFVDVREGSAGIRPMFESRLSIVDLEHKLDQHRERIRMAFYEPLFMAISQLDRREITAREIEERAGEKLQVLGALLNQLEQDLLDPLVTVTVESLMRREMLPPIPESLEGRQLSIRYDSVMIRALRMVGIGTLERSAQFVAGVAAVSPEAFDNLDVDELIVEYLRSIGAPPSVIVAPDVVDQIRNARAQAQQQMAMNEQMQASSGVVKDLGQAGVLSGPEQ